MADLYNTQYFNVETDPEMRVMKVLELVYVAMTEKGYNPVNQIVGYIISGDPTYITSHKNARSLIMKVERDELVEEMLRFYIDYKLEGYAGDPFGTCLRLLIGEKEDHHADHGIGFWLKDGRGCHQ